MRIVDEETLDRFRGSGRCSWCHKYVQSRDPAHISAKGMGGGKRLDIAINLVSLCRQCHTASHAGKSPTRAELLALVAVREQTTVEEIVDEINRLRRTPKGEL